MFLGSRAAAKACVPLGWIILLACSARTLAASADSIPLGDAAIEFLSGSKTQGTITAIGDGKLSLFTTIGGRKLTRQYPLDRIEAVTVDGTRYVVNEPRGGASPGDGANHPAPSLPQAVSQRSKAEVDKLIDQIGQAAPDWYESTPLEYPDSLDLGWPEKPPGDWNAHRNVGQYVWDIINPNPGKWKSGIRFMHFMLEKHAADAGIRVRAMETLGRMYFDFFQDYPRAAFWLRAAGVERSTDPQGVRLAECYWRMGSRQMAVELLQKLPGYYHSIKLWADMGEIDRAVALAEAFIPYGYPDMAYLSAGDACRTAERLDEAVKYYEQVLKVPAAGRAANRIEKNKVRARANIESIKLYDALDLSRVPDGKYSGMSPAYAGDLFIEVTVASGRIQTVVVTRHQEKQFYSAISDTTGQIVKNQRLTGIDATTGATITSEAIINATAKALAGAMK